MAITVIGGVADRELLHAARDPGRLLAARPQESPAPAARGRLPPRRAGARRRPDDVSTPSSRSAAPVTTLMTFIAIAMIGGHLDLAAARSRLFPDITLPGHRDRDPLRRLDARGSRAAHRARRPRKRSRRCRASRRSARRRRETGAKLDRPAVPVGPRRRSAVGFEVRTKLDSIRHEFPPSAEPHPDQMFAAGDDRDPGRSASRRPGRPDRASTTRSSRYLKQPIERLDGVARVVAAGRRAARAPDPRRPDAPRRLRRRHRRACATLLESRELLGQRGRDDRAAASALHGAADRRVPHASTTCATSS